MSSYVHTENEGRPPYLPVAASIERVARLTERERLFAISPEDKSLLQYSPGQFFMAGLPGYGEAPFSVASPPGANGHIEFCIRAVGNLTEAIHRLKKGERLWIRGPFGRGFDLKALKGRDLLFVAGGIGMVPMRSLVRAVAASRKDYGALTLIYGSKTPEEILFAGEADEWRRSGMEVMLTVDRPAPQWKGGVGVVTTLMNGLKVEPSRTTAVVIGPPVMYRFVVMELYKKHVEAGDILVSLERRMKCGLGKCGHCQINSIYVCQEGPVFRLSDLKGLPEAL